MPLVLSLVVTFLLPSVPAAAQGATPESWQKGAGTVTDNFSQENGRWTVDSGRDALRTIARGRLTVRVPEAELFRWSTLDVGEEFGDFYAEAEATEEAGAADAMLGVIFRYVDVDNFYAFLVSGDGWYALLKYVEGEVSRPIEWTETRALETGAGATNQLGVLADGRALAVYANGEELDQVQDPSFSRGQIALLAGTSTDGGLEVSFDNFGLWNKPPVGRRAINRSPTPTPQPAASRADALVISDSLNVRGGPGTNYPVVGSLKRAEAVQVAGRSEDGKWAKLGFSDVKEAWASAQYLEFAIDFGQVAVANAPAAPVASTKPPAAPKKNLAWLVVENHIGRYITLQVNDQNYQVEGKVGETPGRFRFELQGVGRYRVAAQLPNGGSHNWDLYVEPTADKCIDRQGCVALGQTFLQTYY